jgi:hypothetical protein
MATTPAVAFTDLAAEVQTEVRLLRATQAEFAAHATQREYCYRWVDPPGLARSLPGLAEVGGPALVATMGDAHRFAAASRFRSFTGLAPRASETGNTDRKGQPISKAGNRLLRTTLVRAADTARRQDLPARPHLPPADGPARQGPPRRGLRGRRPPGRAGLGGHGPGDAVCDLRYRRHTGHPHQAKAIIAEHWTVPEEVRRRRRSSKTRGKAPHQVLEGHVTGAQGDPPRRPVLADSPPTSSSPNRALDNRTSIGNQLTVRR